MPEFNRSAASTWTGDLRGGSGVVSTESGALKDARITFVSRFENGGGSNPEELVAAAHAACFSMALSADLGRAGHKPDSVTTRATVTLRMDANGPKVAKIHLETEGRVPGIDQATFAQIADGTKSTCPISRLLTPGLEEVTLNATLVQ
jgi:osmotically inducible protein OsmC